MRLSNFQSFGPDPADVSFDSLTYFIGSNGSGKTAVLRALGRLFGFNPHHRGIRLSDFHVSQTETVSSYLYIEAEFVFDELDSPGEPSGAVPDHFRHMQLVLPKSPPRLRIRLTASRDDEDEIEEELSYVIEVGPEGEPIKKIPMQRYERSKIQVHYLPARRDPSEHISYGATTLLGRVIRAADWTSEKASIQKFASDLDNSITAETSSIAKLGSQLAIGWAKLHRGKYFANPSFGITGTTFDQVMRLLTVNFSPGHSESSVPFDRLSDGQQSLLYISLVLCVQQLNREVIAGAVKGFDPTKLRAPTFVLVAIEEPENSLSPHHLGRVISSLNSFSRSHDGQAVVATHAPSVLRRVAPRQIRYMRLSPTRCSSVREILLPSSDSEAHKFVKEAVEAYPELYFSRLVILGEGDSEEVVIPRLLAACQSEYDDSSISVVPLGGRHVNHFWRLLNGLEIPHFTLLDLDHGRNQGGWGRIRNSLTQLIFHKESSAGIDGKYVASLPKWNSAGSPTVDGAQLIAWLEREHQVYFSSPLDLDFSMMNSFPQAYGAIPGESPPDDAILKSVLGKSVSTAPEYSVHELSLFQSYHETFKLGSKPVAHLSALASLTDEELTRSAPPALLRMVHAAVARARDIAE